MLHSEGMCLLWLCACLVYCKNASESERSHLLLDYQNAHRKTALFTKDVEPEVECIVQETSEKIFATEYLTTPMESAGIGSGLELFLLYQEEGDLLPGV